MVHSRMRRGMALALVLGAASCGKPSFDPPNSPAHSKDKDGTRHGLRLERPFLCGDPNEPFSERGVPCPDQRPADELLSCDALGCHGGFDFTGSADASQRHLRGSEGPSCFTCHGNKWDEDEDEEDDEEDED